MTIKCQSLQLKALHSEHLSRSSVRPINNNCRLRDGTSENCAMIYKHLTIQHLQRGDAFSEKAERHLFHDKRAPIGTPWTGTGAERQSPSHREPERSDRALPIGEGLGGGHDSGASPLPRQKGTDWYPFVGKR